MAYCKIGFCFNEAESGSDYCARHSGAATTPSTAADTAATAPSNENTAADSKSEVEA